METKDKEVTWKPFVALLLVVLGLWILSGALLYPLPERGTFGDMFGAVNALFSGLAFATLIYTIHLQRHELKLQREELIETRKELNGQKLQLAAQNELMKSENFESSFFRVLEILADITKNIDIHRPNKDPLLGRDCFSFFYRALSGQYADQRISTITSESDALQNAYIAFYQRHQSDIGHYFRTLYNLVKLVDRSDVKDKRFYTNLIRAQLSSHELLLLFYNCLTEMGQEKFKPLVEKYSLLKTVPLEHLLNPEHKFLYSDSAYKSG
ncbi:putative phage abortive infection protein [Pseudomonas sp. zbq_18]|uniref:putative phage abortive infection protein n=1 Tax=Pseudomonas sp. zbq_18 TaxID=3367251 RepID=UPI00370BAF70